MPKVSVTIITLNEAAHIGAAIDSVAWADEIVVVDSGSTDATTEIARAKGATVMHRDWSGWVDQKNFAAERAAHDWIFSLDADERIPPALAGEIRELLSGEPPMRGYRVPRVDVSPGPVDPHDRLLSRLSDAALRPARGALARQVRARIGVRRRSGRPLPS